MLDYNALKPEDLSRLVDSRIGNPEVDLTFDLVKDLDFTDGSWAVLTGVVISPNSFSTTGAGGIYMGGATQYPYSMTSGKTYILQYDIDISGSAATLNGGNNNGYSPRTLITSLSIGNNIGILIYTSLLESEGLYIRLAGAGGSTVNSLSIKEWNGEELVPDADVGFVANDIALWNNYGDNTLAQDDNAVKVTRVPAGDSRGATIYLRALNNTVFSDLINDQKYRFVFRAKSSAVNGRVNIFNGAGSVETNIIDSEYNVFIVDTTIDTASVPYINFYVASEEVTGLVAAYNMIPNGSTLVDISGNGYDGVIVGAVSGNEGLVTKIGKYVSLSNTIDRGAGGWTFVVRTKPNIIDANNQIGFMSLSSDNSVYLFRILNLTTITVQGEDSGQRIFTVPSFIVGEWYDIIVTKFGGIIQVYVNGIESSTGGLLDANTFVFNQLLVYSDLYTTFGVDGETSDMKFFNYAFSAAGAIAYHNQFAKEISQKHSFDDLGVGSQI